MNRANTISWNPIDEFVEAYESARELDDQAHFVDFLPSPDHDLYQLVAAEVIRVDMEYSWKSGQKMRLQQYRELVPDALDDREVLGQVAFEEYRLRLRAGECASSDEYRTQYGIETDRWPSEIASVDGTDDASHGELMQEALVLADNVQNFPAVGDRFLDFTLQREIGRGAFARVYVAQQGELADRLVVIKVASGHSLEPQHLARLQHTNIVPIYSVHRKGSIHRQDELTAVCMPYSGDRTFADLLDTVREKPNTLGSEQHLISTFLNRRDPTELVGSSEEFSDRPKSTESTRKVLDVLTNTNYVDAVVWLIKQVAEGISHAHERGIVHRDLKPANILLTDEGLPMVLDFNLSENVVVNGRTSLLVGGTLPYMAPEHLEAVSSGGKIGFQTDLFSLGVIFYELLTGQKPFPQRKGSFDNVVRKMIDDRRAGCPSVRTLNHSVPPSIASVVDRCLEANTKDRYGSADDLTDDLDRHLSHRPLAHATNRSIAERGQKWLRRHPRLSSSAGVASIAGILLVAVMGLWMLRGRHLARLEAESTFATFSQEQPSLTMALGILHSEPEVLEDGLNSTRQCLSSYGVIQDDHWRERTAYLSLPDSTRMKLHDRLGELLFLAAKANEKLVKTITEGEPQVALLNETLHWNQLAIDLFPSGSSPRALLLQRADLLDAQGSSESTNALRQQAANQSTTGIIDQYAEVYRLLDARAYGEAKPLLTELRDRSPADPLPWLLLGDANAALGRFNESEGCLTTAIAFWQDSYIAYYDRGRCRMDLGHYQDALSDYQQVIKLRPQLACGYLNRALAYEALGNYEEAIADLTKSLELGDTRTRIYFLRSKLHRRLGDQQAAKQDLDTGLSLTPTDELSWVAHGVAQLKQDANAALADFEQALMLNPVSKTALRNCVHVLADRLDRPQDAMLRINQLLSLNEKDADALASRLVLYARQGNRESAMADIQRLLRMSKEPKALFQAACSLSLTSDEVVADADKAMTLLARAVQVEPIWLYRARTDPDLKNLRQTEPYLKYVEESRKLSQLKLDLNKRSHTVSDAEVIK